MTNKQKLFNDLRTAWKLIPPTYLYILLEKMPKIGYVIITSRAAFFYKGNFL